MEPKRVPLTLKFVAEPVSGNEVAMAVRRLNNRRRVADLVERVEALQAEFREVIRTIRLPSTAKEPVPLRRADPGDRRQSCSWSWLFTTDPACPLCKSEKIHRSHRRGELEKDLSVVALPYRCDQCQTRFFIC